MKSLSESKLYQQILIGLVLAAVLGATAGCVGGEKQGDGDAALLISNMEISLLQCRRSEKNFLLRHDRRSAANFVRWVENLRKHGVAMRSVSGDPALLTLLNDIAQEAETYENAFQDITGLYDSKSFGPVRDKALSKIADEVTLLAEPSETPSSVETTTSLVEAARNLEYYVNILSDKSTPLISILQARRWEKNFQQRYDRLTGDPGSRSIVHIKKIEQEISKIRQWLTAEKTEERPGEEFVRLKSALDRYEHNLGQFTRNVDAFYIKKQEMLRAARNLDRIIKMIQAKVFETEEENEIDGIYYLSQKLPTHQQPKGNYHDVGSLVVSPPSRHGYRHCKNWMQFYFDRDGRYTTEKHIFSIYYHVWVRTVNRTIDVGYETDGKYSGGPGGMDDLVEVAYDDSKGYSTNNGCSLITGKIEMNHYVRGEDIYKFAIKFSKYSGYPSVVMGPNQYSFIIINPPRDSILKSIDNDDDGLTDYEEMFVYYTNPYEEDTDSDGLSDGAETLKGTSANNNDFYSGKVIEGINDTPHIEHYKDISADWIVGKDERYVNSKFTLNGNLFIRDGGSLTLDNCVVDMNRKAKNGRICVDKGGTLTLRKTTIDFNEPGYWYRVVEGGTVETDANLAISGALSIRESILQNGLGIKVSEGSTMDIYDSHIMNCYHLSCEGPSDSKIQGSTISTFIGIPIYCKSSAPNISNTILSSEYSGVGIYCFQSSPLIDHCKIFVCEDDDSDCSAFILADKSHPVVADTFFNAKRVRCDTTSAIMFK